jgi:hypothetical protein
MPETHRLLESASALSNALRANGVAHAFHGGVFVAVLTNGPQADVRAAGYFTRSSSPHSIPPPQEIFCIVEGGAAHPFRRVKQALTGNADLSITPSPWSNRCATLIPFRPWPCDDLAELD